MAVGMPKLRTAKAQTLTASVMYALLQLWERLRDAEIQRSRRWRDPDRGKTRRAVHLWRDKLSENAATVVPMSMGSNRGFFFEQRKRAPGLGAR